MESIEKHPYFFQSGKHKGKLLEWVFVNDPLHVSNIYRNQFIRKKDFSKSVSNELELAIDTLQKKLRRMEVVKACPICKEQNAHYFLLPDSGQVNYLLICCKQKTCKEELMCRRPGELYEISDFLLIISYLEKKEAKIVIKIFKKTHPLHLLAALD